MKKRYVSLILLVLLLTPTLAPFKVIEAQEPEGEPSTVGEVWADPVVFEEFSSYLRLSFSMFTVDFYKGTAGYNVIYDYKGDVVVYEERQVLQYWTGNQWKQRGIPVDLSWVKVSDHQYNVTRHYQDWADTWYNVTFVVRSNSAIKSVISIDSGQTDEYRLLWQLSGIVHDSWVESENRITFGEEAWIAFDWSDVYETLGDITETSIETVAQGRKADIFFNVGVVEAGQRIIIDPATVDIVPWDGSIHYSYMRKGFYAAGRYWTFYWDGYWDPYSAVYESSTDGTSWSSTVRSIGAASSGSSFSVWFDGTYVHYARYNDYDLFYRRGVPESNGVITWCADEQLAHDGSSSSYYLAPTISVDSNGYAWIGALWRNGNEYPKVLKNNRNDGTWQTQFAYTLRSANSFFWKVAIIPLTGGKVYAIYSKDGSRPYGKLYDGGWGAEEDYFVDYSIQDGPSFSAVAEGDDIHFVYNRASTYQIWYNNRTGGSWGATDLLVQDAVREQTAPALSLDTVTGDLYCFWTRKPVDDHVYYKKFSSGVWDADPTDWITAVDDIDADYTISSYYQNYCGNIGLLYEVERPGIVFWIRFAFLTMPGDVPTITSASIPDRVDEDNIYAMHQWSSLTASGTDPDGATDIEKVYIQIKNGATPIAEFRATSLTGTPEYSIQTGAEIFDLNTGACSFVEEGNIWTVTFEIMPEWDCPQYDDLEISVYVEDADTYYAWWTEMQTNYLDIIKRLVTTDFAASDGRMNRGDDVTLSGSVRYATTTSGNTPSSVAPPDDQFTAVRIHNSTHAVMGSDTSISSGAFSLAFSIPDAVQSNSYHVYLDMVDDYTDADAPDGDLVSVIGDRWKLLSLWASEDNPKTGETVYLYATAELEYDGHAPEGDDILVIEEVEFTWDWENERFYASVNKSTAGAITYDTLTSIEEYSYNITLGTMNGLSETVTWGDYEFHFHGLYNENGTFADAKNISAHMPTETEIFEVDGYLYKAFTEEPAMFSWSLSGGGNRYFYKFEDNETIYFFTPDETYSVYSFTIRDYTGSVGFADTFLESLRVINGTEHMIERMMIWDTANTVPLTLVQSQIYALQVRFADGSVYRFGYFIPGAAATPTLSIYAVAFSDQAHIVAEHVTVEATSPTDTHIRVNYRDELDDTDEVFVEVCLLNETQVWNDTGVGDILQFNWYGADNETDYMVKVEITHGFYGELTYTCWLAGAQADPEDPFDLTLFGDWPIEGAFAVFLIIGTACLFSRASGVIGIGVTVLVAAVLSGIGWIDISYSVLAASFTLVVLWGLSGGSK